jgi:hypothetical protein
MTRKPLTIQPKFQPGDRVAERPKQSIISAIRKESREIVAKYTTHRRGVVVDNTLRTLTSSNGRTSRVYYVSVLWDGLKTPSQHSQMRICLEEEYDKLREDHYALTE